PASAAPLPPNVVVDEPVLAAAPLVVRRVVKFGETDAAGVVYTGRFLDYTLEAFEVWFRHVIGLTWQAQHAQGVGTPAVACSLEFSRPLRSGDILDIEVLIDRIGGGSYTTRTVGRNEAGEEVYVGMVTFASIQFADRKPVPLPPLYRERMTAYVTACAGPPAARD
ncbi:MAG: acyl-CoA thioesterase, partial [Candidatus Eiseniibacteriota bacterium]